MSKILLATNKFYPNAATFFLVKILPTPSPKSLKKKKISEPDFDLLDTLQLKLQLKLLWDKKHLGAP